MQINNKVGRLYKFRFIRFSYFYDKEIKIYIFAKIYRRISKIRQKNYNKMSKSKKSLPFKKKKR